MLSGSISLGRITFSVSNPKQWSRSRTSVRNGYKSESGSFGELSGPQSKYLRFVGLYFVPDFNPVHVAGLKHSDRQNSVMMTAKRAAIVFEPGGRR